MEMPSKIAKTESLFPKLVWHANFVRVRLDTLSVSVTCDIEISF